MPTITVSQGEFKLGIKSDIVLSLEDATDEQYDVTPNIEVVVLNGRAMLCVLKPAAAGTFRECAQNVHQPGKRHRIDVVWDKYSPYYLKVQTRNTRGN